VYYGKADRSRVVKLRRGRNIFSLYSIKYPPYQEMFTVNLVDVNEMRTRWVGHAAGMGVMRNVVNILVGTLEGKRSHGRPRHR
jgi:hypothetical protein